MLNYVKDSMPEAGVEVVLFFADGSVHSGLYSYSNSLRYCKKLYYQCFIRGGWCVNPTQVGATYDGEAYFLNDPTAWMYEKDFNTLINPIDTNHPVL